MLNRLLFIFTMGLLSFKADEQSWYKKVIRDEIMVSFPDEPEYKVLDTKGREAYLLHREGYSCMVGVAPDAIEDYSSYLKASDSERLTKGLRTMEGVANGKISSGNQYLLSMKSFHSGSAVGLDVEYMSLEPSNPDSRKRYSTLLLIKNTLYILDFWYLDNEDHETERERFFKSVSVK